MKWQLEVFSIFRVWIARKVSEIFYPNLPIQEKIDTFWGFLGKSATENFVKIFRKWHSNLKISSDPGNSPKLPKIPSSICEGHLTSRVSLKYPKTSPKPFKAFFNLGARDISRKFPLNSRRFPNFLDFLQILGKVIWLWGVLRNLRKFHLSWEMRILLELPSSGNFWGILRKLPKSNDPHQV